LHKQAIALFVTYSEPGQQDKADAVEERQEYLS
jgi:hypothetical protein